MPSKWTMSSICLHIHIVYVYTPMVVQRVGFRVFLILRIHPLLLHRHGNPHWLTRCEKSHSFCGRISDKKTQNSFGNSETSKNQKCKTSGDIHSGIHKLSFESKDVFLFKLQKSNSPRILLLEKLPSFNGST